MLKPPIKNKKYSLIDCDNKNSTYSELQKGSKRPTESRNKIRKHEKGN